MKPIRVFIDMDGVLVDWDRQYELITGMHPEFVQAQNDKRLRSTNWKKFVECKGFFHASPLPGYRELVNVLRLAKESGLIDDVQICTSAGGIKEDYEEVFRQKVDWLDLHSLLWMKYNIVPSGGAKKNVIDNRYHDILIDDTEYVLEKFIQAGGHGILHKGDVNQTIKKLNEYIETLKRKIKEKSLGRTEASFFSY